MLATQLCLSFLLAGLQGAPSGEVVFERASAAGASLRVRVGELRPASVQFGGESRRGLEADGFGVGAEAGRPLLPKKRFLVEVPQGASVSLRARALAEELVSVSPVDVAPGDAAARPEAWAAIDFVGVLRDRRVASVSIEPVRLEGARVARVAKELAIELVFAPGGAVEPTAAPDNGPFGALTRRLVLGAGSSGAGGASPPSHGTPQASSVPPHGGPPVPATPVKPVWPLWTRKITVDAEGLYQVTAADLAASGLAVGSVDPRRLVLTNKGQSIPIEVEGEADGVLDPNDRVLFYGVPAQSSFTRVNAYFLEEMPSLAPSQARMATIDGTYDSTAPTPKTYRATVRAEQNNQYWQLLPNGLGQDHWFWAKTIGPSSNDYSFDTPYAAGQGFGSSTVDVRARYHGFTDAPQNPDHHTRLSLNGTVISDANWNGIVPYAQWATVSAGLLAAGPTMVRVEQVNDLGALIDGIYLDWIEVAYDRWMACINDEQLFPFDTAQKTTMLVRNFSVPTVHLLDVTDPAKPARIVNGSVSGAGTFTAYATVQLAPPAGSTTRTFHYVAEPAVRAPLAVAPLAPVVSPAGGADWIAIAPQDWLPALAPLAAARSAQGLRVQVLSYEQVVDGFGFGIEGPDGIRELVRRALIYWNAPAPTHLLLLGDATIDPLDHLGSPVQQVLPAGFRQIVTDGEIPTDNIYAAVLGTDPLPDINVGRIPAATLAEATAAITKILQREQAAPAGAWRSTVFQVADKGLPFTTTCDLLASQYVTPPFTVSSVYADTLPTNADVTTAILGQLTSGCAIATYLGHGATTNWGTYIALADAAGLANGLHLPFVLALTCSNGYFASPYAQHGLAETFVLNPAGGGHAAFASSAVGFLSQVTAITKALYPRAFQGQSLGACTTGSKLDAYLQAGILEDNLWSFALFGDPGARAVLAP